MRYGKIDSSICRRGPVLPLPEKGENSAMEEKMNESAAVDELAQETQKVVYGEKTFEPHIPALARRAAAEGAVLLKNEGSVLPLPAEETVAVFGRVQFDYFYVGYGSGGDVNPPYTVNLIEGLRAAGVRIDEALASVYADWSAKNPPDMGEWATWPRYFEEMPLTDSAVHEAAARCGTALVVIGRSAGESRENALEPGSYYLTQEEKTLLSQVTAAFSRVAVVIDAGSVMDLSWLDEYPIGAALLVWQGGMESGNAAADVLTGKVNPCGKLTDTVAKRYEDYPSAGDFLGEDFNCYTEDIYVGCRYFETFAPEAVQFPFGFGLSYTSFALTQMRAEAQGDTVRVWVTAENTGALSGREVVQVYGSAPQGVLGKPARVLAAFGKTRTLAPGESETLALSFPLSALASYDDGGVTGHKSAWVLEAGEYGIYAGADVRRASLCGSVTVPELRIVSQLQEICPPSPAHPFDRLVNRGGKAVYEPVPTASRSLRGRILDNLPAAIPFTGDRGIRLRDVADGLAALDDFLAQIAPEDLDALSRGDITMDSPLGAKGNAAVMGGITESLRALGVPPITTTDGPSGIRLQYYTSLLPCGTALACTWDPVLVEGLYQAVGREMVEKGSDVLLAPGMNIHRNPLCGRNFEYFSEDPLVSGRAAAAVVRGIQKNGVSACPKHFACNNQETNRNRNDSRVSERALREIYLKGFEICVKEGRPQNLMTSYNLVNGVWSHYNYDLCTTVLRGEWGYDGSVMTDWWMQASEDPDFPALRDSAYRIRAQVDVLMPGSRPGDFPSPDEPDPAPLASCAAENGLTIAELQRGARNVLGYILRSNALRNWKE